MKSRTLTTSAPASTNGFPPHYQAAGEPPPACADQRIRLLLADDHPFVRRGIVACLERCPNLQVIGEAADGQEALRQARELLPDVVLTDIYMPGLTGLALAETLHKELPKIKVLLLSTHTEGGFVLRCIQTGANGYVLKQASTDEFVQAIETVHSGAPYFSPEVARVALNQMVRGNGPGPNLADLTPREREVLIHIAEGLCNKEIGCCLNIGTRTVETHRERLMRKLDIHSIAGLTKFAATKGLITVHETAAAWNRLPVPSARVGFCQFGKAAAY